MSNSVEDILKEIAELPSSEQDRLRRLLDQRHGDAPMRSPRMPSVAVPDSAREFRWLTEHAREYAGQWVALDGDRLIANGKDAKEVFAAADATGIRLPLVTFVEDPKIVYAGF